ncbi:MAG: B12-binding domain-containing radical SAM protein [Candidatus Methylomirabilia bacterium]
MGLDILLINVGGTRKVVYQDLCRDFSAVDPPFWAALTAGFLRRHGFSVAILDAGVLNLDVDETVAAAAKADARIVDVVVYGQQANTCAPLMTAVGRLCSALKVAHPEMTVTLSGWHPTALPERTMREEACDMLAEGEGFQTLLGLLRGDAKADIPGLWWREGGVLRHNPRAPNVEDLDTDLPDVAWDLLPLGSGRYRAFNWMTLQNLESRARVASLLTSLGCPYRCSFCAIHATYGDRRVRRWSPAWALRQIDILHSDYGVVNVNLNDEFFVLDPRHYLPIATGLVQRNYGMNFCAFARVDRIDAMGVDELFLLKRAGFNWLKLGIESASPEVLRRAHKGTYDAAVTRRVVKKIHDAGIAICANFIFGLPGDTRETMQATLDLAGELNCAFPSFFCAMAPPGSDLYDECLRNGTRLPAAWDGYAQQGYEFLPLPTETLSAAEVLTFRDQAFDAYFRKPRYLDMIGRKFGRAAREHVEAMTKVRLRRRLLGD